MRLATRTREFVATLVGMAAASAITGCGRYAQSGATIGESMHQLFEVQNISVSVHRPADLSYEFAFDGNNLPRWASGLGHSVRFESGAWIADGPLGRVAVRFAARNQLGVLDHDVTLPSGQVVHNPMRVVPNGNGCTVTFTLMRLPGVSEQKFHEDAQWVERDLVRLKQVLEDTK